MSFLKNLIILILLSATAVQANGFVELLSCEAQLSSSPNAVRLRLLANLHGLAVILPQLSNQFVSTTTYTLETTLESLRIAPNQLDDMFRGKSVLLIGEGFGEFLPKLVEVGAQVKAVDPLYALKDLPAEKWKFSQLSLTPDILEEIARLYGYLAKYKKHLVPGVSFDLPFPNAEFDFVISNMLLNNFYTSASDSDPQDRARRAIVHTVLEAGRVLKPGGFSYHSLVGVPSELVRWTRAALAPPELALFLFYPRLHVVIDEDIPLRPHLIEATVNARNFNAANLDKVPSRLITVTRP